MVRRLLAAAGISASLVLLALGAGGLLVVHNLPDAAAPRIPGLAAPVSVSFDDHGVPLVKAASLEDAFRVQGYLTARERLFQMELQRRSASGELAALFGGAVVDLDRRHRTYGFARVAAAAEPLLPADQRAHLAALSDGINAFLDAHAGRLGLELALLGIAPRRYTPSDSLLVLLLMYEDLTSTWEEDAAYGKLAALPEGVRRFLRPGGTRDDVTLVADAAPFVPPALPELDGRAPVAARLDLPRFTPREGIGSNNWVVAGRLTKSGRPMLANDPHLGLSMPAIWLPMRFEIGGRAVEGVTLPGLPGVILGRNDRLAWGFTNLGADVEDLYRETIVNGRVVRGAGSDEVRTRAETIAVRGGAPVTVTVRETSHGPIVSDLGGGGHGGAGVLALKWTALDPANLRLPTASVMMAATPDGMESALAGFTGPAQNVVWASADGRIGWRASGLLPIRRAGTDGGEPYDGRNPENDWKGSIPQASMPRVVDPPLGYLVTANQRVVGTSFPFALGTSWPSPSRARRIRGLLDAAVRAGHKLDRGALEAIQLDVVSEPLRALMEPLVPVLPSDLQPAFRAWDGRGDAGSSAFLVARTVRRKLRDALLKAWHADGWSGALDEDLAVDLVTSGDAAFRRAGLGPRDAFLKAVVDGALAELSSRFGPDRSRWSWGEANRLAVRHPLGRVPGLSFLFDPPAVPQAGASQTVRAASASYGQSMRLLVDWGSPEETTLVVPFGVSGHAGSRHRLDQFPLWRAGDPDGRETRFARGAVGATLEFEPW